MIGQVQTVGGQKQIVPLTDTTPVDVIESGNTNSVTSNAVYDAFVNKSFDKMGTWGLLGGCSASTKTNFEDLIHEVSAQTSGGGICGGSINTSATSKGIPSGWYNFLYIPHRDGRGGDNYKYGILLVFPMTSNTQYFYYIHHSNGTIYDAIPSYALPTSQPSLLPNGSVWVV